MNKQTRRYKALIFWAVIILYLVFSYGSFGKETEQKVVSGIDVRTVVDSDKSLISPDDITRKVRQFYPGIDTMQLRSVELDHLEHFLAGQPAIKRVDAYKTYAGKVMVEVEQRTPILRIIKSGRNAYLDESGKLMPFSGNYTPHVPVATGFIPLPDDFADTSKYSIVLTGLFELSNFLRENPLWEAQIEQIYVDRKQEFYLIPRVGRHHILLGEIDDYETKFKKLEALYTQAFRETGWNTYRLINLKYKNQVVCTKY